MITASDAPLLAVFAAVVRHGSFSGAAQSLRLSKSVVSQRVKQLEERCGARLLERTTRRLRLTDTGTGVLSAAHQLEDALDQLTGRLAQGQREPTGTLRVATTNDLGPLLVAPVVARFVQAHPQVRVEIIAEDAQRDVIDARIDIAVRMGAPKDSSYTVRRLAVLGEPIVAAPALAGRWGRAERPADLSDAPWLRHALLATATLRFTGPDGQTSSVSPQFRVEANAGSTLLALLLHGAAIGVLPEHALREHIRAGRLIHLCPGWLWKKVSLYALLPSRAQGRPATQIFLSMLRSQIARERGRWASSDGIV